jgi:hypothetical protein
MFRCPRAGSDIRLPLLRRWQLAPTLGWMIGQSFTRFTGDRIARQAILNDRRIERASPDGRLTCDETVARGTMHDAIARAVDTLTSSGVVSAPRNRRAFRIAKDPLDMFRNYMAVARAGVLLLQSGADRQPGAALGCAEQKAVRGRRGGHP